MQSTHTPTPDPLSTAHNMAEDVPAIEVAVELARQVGEHLRTAGMMCATAESCTGGLIGHLFTETPGSSDYFAGGAITYSYPAKQGVLGVDPITLNSQGAVSHDVAQQMAHGALQLYKVGVAVAVTGVAGPGGGTAEKPVGTVHIHVSAADGYEEGQRYVWNSDRAGNKQLSAQAALQMILNYLQQR